MEKFMEIVRNMTKEYKERDGCVTCEFSTSQENLGEKLKFLNEINYENTMCRWTIQFCRTCESYNKETPFHVQIEEV